jgi:hypothetical protein
LTLLAALDASMVMVLEVGTSAPLCCLACPHESGTWKSACGSAAAILLGSSFYLQIRVESIAVVNIRIHLVCHI